MLALVGACILLSAPGAMADPPANDKFEDAEDLGSGLPVLVARDNAEAMEEGGESLGAFAAGHSVWFSWEAAGDGFVTVGTCEASFPTVLAVFTGTELNALTPAAGGNADEGPHCPNEGRELTFKAIGGTVYTIAVDGNAFSLGSPPATEGEFTLRVEATPPPANDDFSNATAVTGETIGDPGGEQIYRASVPGYTWGAGKEAEEPDHGGDAGGASVWYAWTAPASGTARITACCGWSPLRGVYTGDAVNSLLPVPPAPGVPANSNYFVTAGATYRIAVDGVRDPGSGEAETGSFELSVFMQLPGFMQPPSPGPAGAPAPPAVVKDTNPPNTRILRRLLKRRPPIWIFRFRSNERGSTFRCKLDRRRYRRCGRVRRFRCLRGRRHVLRVFAVDASGNRDRSPAVTRFRTKCKPHPRSRRKQRQR